MTKDKQVIIPLDVSDFVMAPEALIEKHGGICALVYGRVWRYAQQKSGVCTASHSTIAKALRISRQTVQKYVALLVSEEYLKDVTPDGAEYATKHYATTPHLVFSGRITATVGGTPVKKTDKGVSKKQTTPVKKVDTKKELKKDSQEKLKDSRSNDRNRKDSIRKALEKEFSKVTCLKSPLRKTDKQKRAAGELWWSPLREIAELCEWDEVRAESLVRLTVMQMRHDGLTVSTPKSILNVAKAIDAIRKTDAYRKVDA